MLKSKEQLHIIPLKLQQLFVLSIVDDKHLVLLPFDLLLEVNIIVCGFHQADSQVTRNDHVHDVNLLDHHAVDLKFLHEVFFQVMGQFGLYIPHFRNSLLLDEVSDPFVAFFLEKLFKPVGAEVVKELFDVLLLVTRLQSTDMEVYSNVHGDPYVIFRGDIRNRTFVPNRVLGDHAHDFVAPTATGVAASEPGRHDAGIPPKLLLHGKDSVGNVQLPNAASLVSDNGHDRYTLRMMLRYFMRRLLHIIHIELNQMGSWFELPLELIMLLHLTNSLSLVLGLIVILADQRLLPLLRS